MPQDATNKLPPEMVKALTEQLRDVHLPDAVSWWPLAWGWWALIAIIICIVSVLAWQIKRSINKNRYRGLAVTELESAISQWREDGNSSAYLQSANAILKRAVLHTGLESSLATTSGKIWTGQLNQWSAKALSEVSQNALAYECYQQSSDTDINAVHAELVRWLKKHQVPTVEERNKTEHSITQTKRGQHA